MQSSSLPFPLFHPESNEPMPLAMAAADFRAAFPRETGLVEFKSGASQRALQEAVVGLSNSNGGVVLIGVDDDGNVLGRELTQNVEETIHQAIAEARHPGKYSLHRIEVDGRPVIALSIARRVEGFAQTSSGRVLVRRGPRNVALFDTDLLRFIQERSLDRYELHETNVALDDASNACIESLSAAFGWDSADPELTMRLAEQGLVSDHGKLTVAGSLYLLEDPSEALGKAYVEIMRFAQSAGGDYDRRVEIRGPLHEQVRRASAFVSDELGSELIVIGTQRHDLPRLPQVVIREAIANAVAHRQYEDSRSAVRIEMRPSQVRVISPGPLPTPVTVENIRDAQAPRNIGVIRVLRRFKVAEDAGRGVDVMQDSMRAELLDPPTFIDTGHSVEVVLSTRSAVTPKERAWIRELEHRGDLLPRDRMLLVHAARGEVLTNRRARDLTGLDRVETTRALQRLKTAGLLVQHGSRGGSSYQLANDLTPPSGLRLTPDELRRQIVDMAKDGPVTNASVRERFGLDRAEALRMLRALVDSGDLVQAGSRRGTRYHLPH